MIKLTIPSNISGLLRKYNDGFLADDSLSDLNVVLLSLYLIEHKTGKSGASYNELKEMFVSLGRKEDYFRQNLYGAKKQNMVEEKGEAIYFLIGGLKRIEKVVGQTEKTPVYLVKSGEQFTAIKLLEEFLISEINDNEILLCDPHISSATLFPLSILKNKVKSIKILCSNIYDHEKFLEYKKKFVKETNIAVETKVNNKIHDRYLICGKKCWSVGTSIKDLGNKDTTIRELDEIANSLKELFTERWNEAS